MATQSRNSNIELLRIIIMFMILLLHSNFLAFDIPKDYSLISFSRCFAEAFTLTPVNIFVLITGFFGTHFSIRKSTNLIFQVIFCVVPISLVLLACGIIDFNYRYFFFHKYWFINAYIGLLAFTPVLNIAVEKFTKKEFKSFLIIFYFIAFISAMVGLRGIEIAGGYSLIWFIFLYLLGRYIMIYQPLFACSKNQLIVIILVICLCKSMVIFSFHSFLNYVEPFIVIQSVCTLLLFTKFAIKNNVINSIAASTTMVYLVNLHPALWEFMKIRLWSFYLNNNTFIFILYTILLCVAVFAFAIGYDKLRLFVWNKIESAFSKKQIL